MGEALFVIASCAGLMFIMQNSLLKNKKLSRTSRLLPSLSDLDRINHICLLGGFPVLSLGIIAGAVFAGISWQSGWLTDPESYLGLLPAGLSTDFFCISGWPSAGKVTGWPYFPVLLLFFYCFPTEA